MRSNAVPAESSPPTPDEEQCLRTVADTMPVVLWITAPDGHCTFLSHGWYEFTGQPEDAGLGFGWLEVVHPDDRARIEAIYRGAQERRQPFTLDYRLRRADGQYRWALDEGRPRHGDDGTFVGYAGAVVDIDARKHAEERLDLVLNAAEIGLWYCDLPLDRLSWNDYVRRHYGIAERRDVTIEDFWKRIHPDDRARTARAIDQAIEHRAPYDIEHRTIGEDGVERWVRSVGRASFDGDTPRRFDGVSIDVTHRVRYAEALEASDRRKDEFLATLAHELRNPLAPLRNGLQIIRLSRNDPAAIERAGQMMERQLTHMVRLIDDLMDVSRIRQGKFELRCERTGLAGIVLNAIEASRPLIDAKRHELHVELPRDDVQVEADPVRIAQVVSNLLGNAAKYTDPHGRIELRVEAQVGYVIVRVRDNGVGIRHDMLPRVFEPFTQVEHASARGEGGLGLGLSIVKRIVEMHGGTVEARSAGEGQGSEFTVWLPIRLAGECVAPRRADAAPQNNGGGLEILVVDDNRDAAASLATMLDLLGHHVAVATDGEAGIEMSAVLAPDVVFLDIGMPVVDGYAVARAIRARPGPRQPALIAVTGFGSDADRAATAEAGFDRHLVKPLDLGTLASVLEAQLARRAGA